MLATDLPLLLIPIWILLGLVVLLGILALLGRIQGGRYLKPLFGLMAKVPHFAKAFAGRWRIVEMDNWESDFLDLVEEGVSPSRASPMAYPFLGLSSAS